MTKFQDKKFSVAVGSEKYRQNYDAVFPKEYPCLIDPRNSCNWRYNNRDLWCDHCRKREA